VWHPWATNIHKLEPSLQQTFDEIWLALPSLGNKYWKSAKIDFLVNLWNP